MIIPCSALPCRLLDETECPSCKRLRTNPHLHGTFTPGVGQRYGFLLINLEMNVTTRTVRCIFISLLNSSIRLKTYSMKLLPYKFIIQQTRHRSSQRMSNGLRSTYPKVQARFSMLLLRQSFSQLSIYRYSTIRITSRIANVSFASAQNLPISYGFTAPRYVIAQHIKSIR